MNFATTSWGQPRGSKSSLLRDMTDLMEILAKWSKVCLTNGPNRLTTGAASSQEISSSWLNALETTSATRSDADANRRPDLATVSIVFHSSWTFEEEALLAVTAA